MTKGFDRKLAKLERQQDRVASKIQTMKRKHARDLMNEARKLLGRSPITSRRGTRAAKKSNGPTFSKKPNGGGAK